MKFQKVIFPLLFSIYSFNSAEGFFKEVDLQYDLPLDRTSWGTRKRTVEKYIEMTDRPDSHRSLLSAYEKSHDHPTATGALKYLGNYFLGKLRRLLSQKTDIWPDVADYVTSDLTYKRSREGLYCFDYPLLENSFFPVHYNKKDLLGAYLGGPALHYFIAAHHYADASRRKQIRRGIREVLDVCETCFSGSMSRHIEDSLIEQAREVLKSKKKVRKNGTKVGNA